MSDDLLHYGILRRSGRYPWGSGGDEYARSTQFYQIVDGYKRQGVPEADIAKAVGLSVADLRSTKTIAKEQIVLEETNRVVRLRDKGVSIQKISEQTGIVAPTVRLRLKNSENIKESSLRRTAEVLRKNVDEHKIVDIGKGTEITLGIADTKLKAALSVLRDEGYETHNLPVRSGQHIQQHKVLVPPGTGFATASQMKDKIHTMGDWSENDGLSYLGIHEPLSISSKRLKVNFAEDGGTAEDGVTYVRPGVKDLALGKGAYAQVRISIDGTHYIKGMAVLKDDLPKGVDLVFNSNKSRDVGKLGALKKLGDDADNPYGSVIKRQITEVDPKTGKEKVTSAMNLLREEGEWNEWSNSLPSQVLAKQPHTFIKSQLDATRKQTQARIDEINSITNAVVRKKKLQDFADQIDADAVDLKAAAMPRQRTQVIIPMPKMNKTEIYAPNFETGERVVLIRYPHGGRFEIPEVTVNNNNRTAKKLLGNAADAIGIHPSVAERLSGADFDGDTVVVIPNRLGKIKGASTLGSAGAIFEKGLNNFDPKREYGGFVQTGVDKNGHKVGNFKLMKNTGLEMGKITNLITDMSIQGAEPEHIVRAVRHSMVVIDAEKHELNYLLSAQNNGIAQLGKEYQGSSKLGAKTLLSRATSPVRIPERQLRSAKGGGPIDKKTGELVYEPTGKTNSKHLGNGVYADGKDGRPEERVPKEIKVKRLALASNAYDLVRDPADPVERLYAEHANAMKATANKVRLQADKIPNPKINTRAKEVYRSEVDDLVAQLRAAQKQKPLDRRAVIIKNGIVKAKRQDDPTLREDRDRLAKTERQALAAARARLGLTKPNIEISDSAWDAIQAGAVSASRLKDILLYADPKRVEALALPRANTVVTKAVASRARAMLAAGATNADVARSLGISASTLRAAAVRGDL